MPKRLLILGPSFRRNKSNEVLSALERYDGIYFRVARKYLSQVQNVDVVVMVDDLTLVEGASSLRYVPSKGNVWGRQSFHKDILEKARDRNEAFLRRKLNGGKYSKVFIAMGKKHANALPDLSRYNVKVIFPTHGGLGPKAKALKEWFLG